MIQFVIVGLLALLFIPSSALAQSCADSPVAVQILGSGGPRSTPIVRHPVISFGSMLRPGYLSILAGEPSFALAKAKRSLATCP